VATALGGERDQNACIESADGTRHVLKISNPSEQATVVDFQIAALDHIARRTGPADPARAALAGRANIRTGEPADGSISMVRMLTYLDGVQIKQTDRSAASGAPWAVAWRGWTWPCKASTHPERITTCCGTSLTAHRLRDKMESLIDPAKRQLARHFMTRFEEQVLPRLPTVRAQVIHNDYHLYNVLVAPQEQERITGIIDFGDMLHAPLVGEVATAAAFHMTGNEDPLRPAQFVAAYHAVLPLSAPEQEIVTDLMVTRQLVTALISEWRAVRYPQNRAYIMRHNPAAWEALGQWPTSAPGRTRPPAFRHPHRSIA
jgi:Ser/Thr protein kinase RdoA (MazF antagonist)